MAHFQLAVLKKDEELCIELLKSMLTEMSNKWNINSSPLYRHIKVKEDDSSMKELFLQSLINEVNQNKELAFLKDNLELLELIK